MDSFPELVPGACDHEFEDGVLAEGLGFVSGCLNLWYNFSSMKNYLICLINEWSMRANE